MIQANETQMCQLLQNLIENAIKYCKDAPHIHIAAQREPGFWFFSVKDNGMGIDPQNLDSVFQPFTQLRRTRRNTRVWAWGLPPAKRSSSATADESGWNRSSARERRFSSVFPV